MFVILTLSLSKGKNPRTSLLLLPVLRSNPIDSTATINTREETRLRPLVPDFSFNPV